MTSTSEEIKNLCYNIAWLRKHNGLSKRKMASLLKIGIKSLNKIESGQDFPRLGINFLFAVQEHFGVPPGDPVEVPVG